MAAATIRYRGNAGRAALSPFEDRSQPLPSTDAHGLKPVSHLAAAHFMKQRRGDAGTGHADGMTKRYTRAVDIEHIVATDRKSGVWGTSVSVRVELGGHRIIKKKQTKQQH